MPRPASTRSTARASTTGWRPGGWPPSCWTAGDLSQAWPALLQSHYARGFSVARRLALLLHLPAVPAGDRADRDALDDADDASRCG